MTQKERIDRLCEVLIRECQKEEACVKCGNFGVMGGCVDCAVYWFRATEYCPQPKMTNKFCPDISKEKSEFRKLKEKIMGIHGQVQEELFK